MSSLLNFNNIIKGQQLKIFFDNNKTLIFKTEDISQGTRFVVFGKTLEGEKVLIPAFTNSELDTKYSYLNNPSLNRASNCLDWISKTKLIVTHRFLDIEEIYLLNSEGDLRKYDSAFDGKVCFQKSKFYVSQEPTYDFNNIRLLFLKKRVRDILLKNKIGTLPIDDNLSLITQASARIGEYYPLDSDVLLTMKKKVTAFINKINQLGDDNIDLIAYCREEDNEPLEINDVISHVELLDKLNIKTGLLFTKEELSKLKIKLEFIEQDNKEKNILTVKLKLTYQNDNNLSKNLISSEFKINVKFINKIRLLFNLFVSDKVMINHQIWMQERSEETSFFPQLDWEIAKIDNLIEEFIKLNDEEKIAIQSLLQTQQRIKKRISHLENKKEISTHNLESIKRNKTRLDITIKEVDKILTKNEPQKQKKINDLLTTIKLVNNLQMLSYLQNILLNKSKDYLITGSVFYNVHNLSGSLSFPNFEKYQDYYQKSKNNNFQPNSLFSKIDNLLNDNFSKFVEIYKFLPIGFQTKHSFNICTMFRLLVNFKEIEMNKLLGQKTTIDKKELMAKLYINLLLDDSKNYKGRFSSFVCKTKDLKSKLSNCVNSIESKLYKQQLKDLRVNFWKLHGYDTSTLINELVDIYFPIEKQEILPKFSLEEHFLLEEQLLQTDVIKNDDDNEIAKFKIIPKLIKVNNILKTNQKLSQGFQKSLSDLFQRSKQILQEKLNEERIKAGKWEINDIIAVNSMINMNDIEENKLTYFKVLQKNKDNFTVIIYHLNSKKIWEYKIRDIAITNCQTFNFTSAKENLIFPNQEEIIKSQILINDYIAWKDKTIPKYVTWFSEKIKKNKNILELEFVKIKSKNSFNDWEWEINVQNIKEKILEVINKEIAADKLSMEKVNLKCEQRLNNNKSLKYVIDNNILTFEVNKDSKEKITNLKETINKTTIRFDIIYNAKFLGNLGNYKKQTSEINFKISRDSLIAKQRLAHINKEIKDMKKMVSQVNVSIKTALNSLIAIHNDMIELLENKREEWKKISDHTNLNVQLKNQQLIAQLKLDIKQLNEQLVVIKNKICILSKYQIENSVFYNDYLNFIRYYEQASEEVTPSDIKKYLYWDKNYQLIKNNFNKSIGYGNFAEYKNIFLNNINNIKNIDIKNCKESLSKIAKIKFKKLSWWQKIINKISWTCKKTRIAIKCAKKNNSQNIKNLIVNLNDDKRLTNLINTSLVEKSQPKPLPTSDPWDRWIIENDPNLENSSNLSSENSVLDSISDVEENNNYSDDISKILRELDGYKYLYDSDLESSNEPSHCQEVNHNISRTSSDDTGISFG